MVASLFHRFIHIEHLALRVLLNFGTNPSKTHPEKEDFWDSGEGLRLNNTFEVVKIMGWCLECPAAGVSGWRQRESGRGRVAPPASMNFQHGQEAEVVGRI